MPAIRMAGGVGKWGLDVGVAANITSRFVSGLAAVGLAAGAVAVLAVPAQAAVPDHWGFAYVNKPAVTGIPDLHHQAGNWPSPFKVHVHPGAIGQVFVVFPMIASKGGVVHVTAVTSLAAWCQAQKWGPS